MPVELALVALLVLGAGVLAVVMWRAERHEPPPPARWVVVIPLDYQPARIVYEDTPEIRVYPEIEEFSD